MKRMIGLVAMIVCLCGCAGNSAKVLGTTEFDGKTITFYYDKTLSNNSGVYYTDENSYQYVLEHHLKSDDESTLLYVDYHSAYIIYEEDEVIDPIEIVEVLINDEVWNIAIYHLDTSKEYWQIGQNQKELRVSGCVSSSTGSSAVCTGELDIQKEELENLMSTWKTVSSEEAGISYDDLEIFLELDYGLERINGGLSKDTYLAKLELEDGTMIIQDSSGKLYQLDKEAAEQLNKLIN